MTERRPEQSNRSASAVALTMQSDGELVIPQVGSQRGLS
jgi:hypothetical protein